MSVDMDSNEKNKFENLYYKYKHILFNQAKSILKSENDAEDILQEAFIKIAKNIKSIDDIDSRETLSFIIVITKNTAYDYIRRANNMPILSISEIEDFSNDDDVLQLLVDKLEYQKIVLAITTIPSPYSEVLYLHFVKDFSIKKTASFLERKSTTVKMQLVRGKRILIERLSEVPYE